ncbi:iron ABC transporter permease [Paludisphaera sp.]|uniref:FecCD family ABC transporter permease n=1 Tax=Paludisphaera sp. TaxID=2017432 RepID=UPI00301C41E6
MSGRPARILLLLAILAVVGSLSLGVGSARLSPARIAAALVGEGSDADIVWDLRLPRIILAALVGLALGAAGAAYQGLFRNPLADPYVIGASTGSALGATLVMILAGDAGAMGFGAVSLGAFLGAMGAAGLVYVTAAWWGPAPIVTLLLAGTAVSSCLGAVVWLLMVLHDQELARIVLWMMGSLAGRSWSAVIGGTPYIALGFATLCALARPLDALSLGEQPARALGLPLRRMSGMVVAAASLATAAAVAVAGVIGFVGLIAPHVARAFVGARHRYLIPASGLCGAILLVLADDLARTVAAPTELPVGVLTAILGGPFFLVVLRRAVR